jgi:chromosome transmission fidelity protein 4
VSSVLVSNSRWKLGLVLVVASTHRLYCSRRFLRIFSSGGNQGQVVWLKGEPVTMAGRGRFAAVFYHEGTPLPDGTQQLGYTLYDAVACSIISKGSVSCISKGSSLSWVGFSNDCSLMAMDTDGMMSMLVATDASSDNSFEWAPVLDTVGMRKSADDQFWPVTVYDGKLVCVPLKGGNNYPDAARRPVTATLGMRLPLARSSIAKK